MRIKRINKYLIFVIIFSLIIFPNIVYALAGFSEKSYDCYYTDKIMIEFGDPSDMCHPDYDKSQKCFNIHDVGAGYNYDKNYSLPLLTEINIPDNDWPKHIIGKSYFDKAWLIYDVEADKVLGQNRDKDIMVQEWINLGNSLPKFANTENFLYFFKESEESKIINRENEKFGIYVLLWLVCCFIVFPGISVFLIIMMANYSKNKK